MNTPYVFKKCTKCGKWLVANTVNFHKLKSGKYGVRAICKECVKICNKKRYEENTEKIIEHNKKYREEHIEERKEYDKKRSAIYREEHKEYYADYMKKYNAEHKEEKRTYDKKYYKENIDRKKEYHKEYHKTPQGQVVALNAYNKRRKREQPGNGITKEQWLEMMNFFNWKCAYSGKSIGGNNGNRSIDHIFPLAKGGAHEIWNCVPMDRSLNSSKCDKDLEEWYPQQDFYNENKLNKINEWCKYSYNKWGKNVK